MIHLTDARNVDAILSEGLRTDMPKALTGDIDWIETCYQMRPIFLAMEDGARFIDASLGEDPALATIEVMGDNLSLVADLPSLIDLGGRYDEGYIIWKQGRAPQELRRFLDESGSLEVEYLLDADTDVCRAAIMLTGTAACLENIPPTRLSVRSMIDFDCSGARR
jgi:hypothetical protein